MKVVYRILISIGIVLVLVVGALFLWMDRIGKTAVEAAGEAAMGVTTTLDDLTLKVFRGEGRLEGLTIANPRGFETAHFMALRSGSAELRIGSLLEDTVVMPSIALEGLHVHLEKSAEGANYEVILANMKKGEEPADDGGGKKFRVDEIVVRDIRVRADVAVGGKKLTDIEIDIEEIRLENVGSDTDTGVLLSGLMAKLVVATLKAIVRQGHKILPEIVVNGLGAGLEGVGDLGKVGVRVVGKVTRRVGGKTIDVVGGAAEKVGDVVEGVGGLLGRKKKDKEGD